MTPRPDSCRVYRKLDDMLAEKEEILRHRCPISEEELLSMVEYLRDTMSYTPATHPEWNYEVDTSTFNYIRRFEESAGAMRTRTRLRIPNVSPQAVFCCLFDPAKRLAFDKYYTRFEVSRVIDPDLEVLVSEIDAPVGVSNREFVEWRRRLLPKFSDLTERSNVQYVIYLRSCESDECSASVSPNPNTKKVERAEAWISGYLMNWWFDEENGEILGTEVLIISQLDNRGMIPKFLMNTLTSSGPKKWATSLVNAVCKLSESVDIHSTNDVDLERLFNVVRRSPTESN